MTLIADWREDTNVDSLKVFWTSFSVHSQKFVALKKGALRYFNTMYKFSNFSWIDLVTALYCCYTTNGLLLSSLTNTIWCSFSQPHNYNKYTSHDLVTHLTLQGFDNVISFVRRLTEWYKAVTVNIMWCLSFSQSKLVIIPDNLLRLLFTSWW